MQGGLFPVEGPIKLCRISTDITKLGIECYIPNSLKKSKKGKSWITKICKISMKSKDKIVEIKSKNFILGMVSIVPGTSSAW